MAKPMTPRQRAALKKAQAASAAKRRGTGKARDAKKTARQTARKEIKKANRSASIQKSRTGTYGRLGVSAGATLGPVGLALQNRGYTKKGKAKTKTASEIEAKRLNAVNAAKNKKRRALGKKANKKENYTAKEALKRKRRQALAVTAAVTTARVAYKVHQVNEYNKSVGNESLGQATSRVSGQALHKAANKVRTRKANNARSTSRGIGTSKTHAKTRKASYAKSSGRGKKKVYKVTTAKRRRR